MSLVGVVCQWRTVRRQLRNVETSKDLSCQFRFLGIHYSPVFPISPSVHRHIAKVSRHLTHLVRCGAVVSRYGASVQRYAVIIMRYACQVSRNEAMVSWYEDYVS